MLRRHGWRLLVSATGHHQNEGMPYALDNGAWTAFQKGEPFDVAVFEKALDRLGKGADFAVIPDIVEGGVESLAFSLTWKDQVLTKTARALLAVQDGMTPEDVEPHIGGRVGLFVGGSTEWKLSTMAAWGELGRRLSCWVHVGRVNTVKRINMCGLAGVHSFDGTSASKFSVNVRKLDNARRQMTLDI